MSRFATLAILALAAFGAEVETETKTEVKAEVQAEAEVKVEAKVEAETEVKAETETEQWRSPVNYYAAPQVSYEVIPAKAEPVYQQVEHVAPVIKKSVSGYYADGYLRKDRTSEGPYETLYAKCALQDPEEEAYARGAIRFTQQYGGPVKITGTIVDVTPGLHGFHIHELGDLTKGCTSTGAHLDYSDIVVSGGYGSAKHVMSGDLQQAAANKQGVAYVEEINDKFDLFGSHSIIGRSLVIHKRSDDAKGGAGARIACCTIGVAAPPQKKW